jgi:hypothetical protein
MNQSFSPVNPGSLEPLLDKAGEPSKVAALSSYANAYLGDRLMAGRRILIPSI